MLGAQVRPFFLGFLHTVLTEMPLARSHRRCDAIRRMRFRYGDQPDIVRLTPRRAASGGDARLHGFQSGGNFIFRCDARHAFLRLLR